MLNKSNTTLRLVIIAALGVVIISLFGWFAVQASDDGVNGRIEKPSHSFTQTTAVHPAADTRGLSNLRRCVNEHLAKADRDFVNSAPWGGSEKDIFAWVTLHSQDENEISSLTVVTACAMLIEGRN